MSSMRKEELTELVTWFVGLSLSFFLKCSIAEMFNKIFQSSPYCLYYFDFNMM